MKLIPHPTNNITASDFRKLSAGNTQHTIQGVGVDYKNDKLVVLPGAIQVNGYSLTINEEVLFFVSTNINILKVLVVVVNNTSTVLKEIDGHKLNVSDTNDYEDGGVPPHTVRLAVIEFDTAVWNSPHINNVVQTVTDDYQVYGLWTNPNHYLPQEAKYSACNFVTVGSVDLRLYVKNSSFSSYTLTGNVPLEGDGVRISVYARELVDALSANWKRTDSSFQFSNIEPFFLKPANATSVRLEGTFDVQHFVYFNITAYFNDGTVQTVYGYFYDETTNCEVTSLYIDSVAFGTYSIGSIGANSDICLEPN